MPAKAVIARAGGAGFVIRAIKAVTGESISRQAINRWIVVPPNRVGILSALSGIAREAIRPDIFETVNIPPDLMLLRDRSLGEGLVSLDRSSHTHRVAAPATDQTSRHIA